MLLKFSLKRAKYLFSTSKAMAQEGRKYTKKSMKITPFGVDVNLFSPEAFCRNEKDGRFIIGTVKSLNPKYGIDYILRAVKIIRDTAPEIPISLRIAGAGSHEEEYRSLSNELGISDVVTWLGFIPQQEVAKEWANMDIAIVYSNSESFGVSAVEAQACGTPVIISDVPGLMEATSPEKTSVVVPGKNEQALAEEIIRLYNMPEKRKQMGKTGRDYVLKKFEINTCFEDVEEFYKQLADD